jgi:hypothetical protein
LASRGSTLEFTQTAPEGGLPPSIQASRQAKAPVAKPDGEPLRGDGFCFGWDPPPSPLHTSCTCVHEMPYVGLVTIWKILSTGLATPLRGTVEFVELDSTLSTIPPGCLWLTFNTGGAVTVAMGFRLGEPPVRPAFDHKGLPDSALHSISLMQSPTWITPSEIIWALRPPFFASPFKMSGKEALAR